MARFMYLENKSNVADTLRKLSEILDFDENRKKLISKRIKNSRRKSIKYFAKI